MFVWTSLISSLQHREGFPTGPRALFNQILWVKGNLPAGRAMWGLVGCFPFLLELLALLSALLVNVRSARCGERLQPSGAALGRGRGFYRTSATPDAEPGLLQTLLSCGASFLLLPTLSFHLTSSETLFYSKSKPWLPLMLFPVNSLLVVNLRALGTLILQLLCQENFLLPLLAANPLSSQIHNASSPACLPFPPSTSFVHIYLFGFVFLLLFCAQSHHCHFSV